MEEKTTLFTYVYGSIRQDILQGVLPYGAPLPSLHDLSARYHVGMRTVRDVMAALRDDGYIETCMRKRAVVRYRSERGADPEHAVETLLARRFTVEQSLRTMEAIVPAVFAACAEGRIGERDSVVAVVETAQVRGVRGLGSSSLMLHEVLEAAGNATLSECYARLERAVVLPRVAGRFDPYLDAVQAHRGMFATMLAGLASGEGESVRAWFQESLADVAVRVEAFFEELAVAYPHTRSAPSAFEWNAKAGRVFAHAEVTRDLVERIASGNYAIGSFLPSIQELSRLSLIHI